MEAATTNPIAPHYFWSDSVTLSDRTLIKPTEIVGAKQITDIYLLALCQRNGGTLVTFDTAISLLPIIKPHPNLIQILTPH